MIAALLTGPLTPCAEADDPDICFPFPLDEAAIDAARDLCRRCHLVTDCLEYAIAHDVLGIWGGSTAKERAEIRRRRRVAAAPLVSGTSHRPTRDVA